jgi:hypothetical protein
MEALAIGTPIDLGRLVHLPLPATRVHYTLRLLHGPTMEQLLQPVLAAAAGS